MPVRTANPPSNPRNRRKAPPAAPSFQAPLVGTDPDRPTDHNGVPVEREELRSNLPSGSPFKISRLHLANGELAWACRDCLFTGDRRADVAEHRNEKHGARFGKKTVRVLVPKAEKGEDLLDAVLPPRADGSPAPSSFLERTVGEFLAIAPTLAALSDTIERLEEERDTALNKVIESQISRADRHKIAVHDELRDEVADLKAQLARSANYEEIKAELYELRLWKRNVIKKLHAVGFKLEEE